MKNTGSTEQKQNSRERELPTHPTVEKSRSPSALRHEYLEEKARIQSEIGDLNDIRIKLGLSQRRICQLMLIDPSAWTRWLKTGAPPHIYQALKWLLELKELNPDAAGPSDVSKRIDHVHASAQAKIKELESNMAVLERVVSAAAVTSVPPSHIAPTSESRTLSRDDDAAAAIESRLSAEIADLQDKMKVLMSRQTKSSGKTKPTRTSRPKGKARRKRHTQPKLKANPKRKVLKRAIKLLQQTKKKASKRHLPKKIKTKGHKPKRR